MISFATRAIRPTLARGAVVLVMAGTLSAVYAAPVRAAGTVVVVDYSLPAANRNPYLITTGPDGALWFAEQAGYIGRITTTGVVTEYTVPTPNSNPVSIAVGPDGNLWFSEYNVGQIGRITPAGTITEFSVGAGTNPIGIVAGPDGALWFAEVTASKIGRMTTAGVVTNEYAIPGSASWPRDIVLGPDGALWFTEQVSARVGRITTTGAISQYPVSGGTWYIAPGPDGALWFSEPAVSKIGRITTTAVITEYALTPGAAPLGVTTGPDNDVWFAEVGSNKIGRITVAGLVVGEYDVPTAGGGPWGITRGPDSAMWFTENGGGRIGRVMGIVAPTVSTVSPSSGPASGGTVVTVAGTGYAGVDFVDVGGVSVTQSPCPPTATSACFTVNPDGTLTLRMPPGGPGKAVDIRVNTPGGLSPVVPAGRFFYGVLAAVAPTPAPAAPTPTLAPGPPVPQTGLNGTRQRGATGPLLLALGWIALVVARRIRLERLAAAYLRTVVARY